MYGAVSVDGGETIIAKSQRSKHSIEEPIISCARFSCCLEFASRFAVVVMIYIYQALRKKVFLR